MAKDFRADQIRFHTIIASGTKWPRALPSGDPAVASEQETNDGYHTYLQMMIMGTGSASDFQGNFADRGMFKKFGDEPWLVFSGTRNLSSKYDKPNLDDGYPRGSAVLFLGDVIISGTLFGTRQVINVDPTVDGDFHVNESAFISGNLYSTQTSLSGDTSDNLVLLQGNNDPIKAKLAGSDNASPPRVLFRKTSEEDGRIPEWKGENRKNADSFVIFSGSKGTRGQQNAGIALFEGDVHISGNLSVEGAWEAYERDIILNNSASTTYPYPPDWRENGSSGPFTTAGPIFGHATTGAMASSPGDPGAGPRNHTNPFYIREDAWQVYQKATTAHGEGGSSYTIPSHWYSNFVNSSSIDSGTGGSAKRGGFRFIVAASGSTGTSNIPYANANYDYTIARDGRGTPDSSVFTISGSGDISLDPYKSFVFDSRTESALTITHIKGPNNADPQTNHALRFTASTTYPAHYNFVRGEVTGSGGFHLPALQNAHSANTRDGQQGQLSGITFQGEATGTERPDVAIFYQKVASANPQHDWPVDNSFVITASNPLSDIMIGAGDDLTIKSGDDTKVYANDDIWILAGIDHNESNGEVKIASRAGSIIFGNRGGVSDTLPTENIFQITHNSADATDTAQEGGYTVQLNSSGSTVAGNPSTTSYLMFSGSGTKGAHTIKTVDQSGAPGSAGHLTIKPDGTLFMTGSRGIQIDAGGLANNIMIAGNVNHGKVTIGHSTVANTGELELNAAEIDINAGATGIAIYSEAGGAWTTDGTTAILSKGDLSITAGDTSAAAILMDAKDTTNGIQIGRKTAGGWPTNVPITIGGDTSLVTIGNDLQVGTLSHSGSVDVWGDLTVHGTFIKGHIISASMEDPLLFLNSGSKTANSGGGVAIASGSHETWTHSTYPFSPAMVFGRDAVSSDDTFLVGRMDAKNGDAIDLIGAQPINMRAAGFKTAAGMTMTASMRAPGVGVYTVRAGNTGSAGRLILHAGTTDGGSNLGPFHLSGSYFTFSRASKVYLDDSVNDVYFRSQQGGSSDRLDLNLKSSLRLQSSAILQFDSSDYLVRRGDGSNSNTLMLKANGQTLQMSASAYSMGMSAGQYLYFDEDASDAIRLRKNGNYLELEMAGAMQGLNFPDDEKIFFGTPASKYIDGTGQQSDQSLTYLATKEVTIGSRFNSTPTRVTAYAGKASEWGSADETGAIIILSSSATGLPDQGYTALGFTSKDLEYEFASAGLSRTSPIPAADRGKRRQDVTLIFSGTTGNLPLKQSRGTALFTGDVVISGSMAVGEYIYHDGNESDISGAPQTAIRLQDRGVKLIASGTEMLHADGVGSILSLNINPDNGQVSTQIKGYSPASNKPIMLALAHDSSNRATFHNTFSTDNPNIDPANGHDVLLFFSGAIGSKYQAGDTGAAVRATALFGGDVYVSGALGAETIELPNLTLTDTNPYLRFYDANTYIKKDGTNLNFYDAALGTVKSLTQLASLSVSDDLFSVTRTALNVPNYGMSTGSFSFDSGFNGYSDNNPRPTNLVSYNNSGAGNSDVYFFVSGAIGMKARAPADIANQLNRRSVALFGGDVHISGTLTSNNTTFGASSLGTCYDTNNSGETEAGGGREIIADAGEIVIKPASVNPTANSIQLAATGSGAFGQIRIAPIAAANGFYEYGGVFVTGSAGKLGFGVGGATASDIAFSVNSNNNIEIGASSGNSRKIYWDPNEASTFIQYTNTNAAQPGPKILHFANRTADGRISFSAGSGGSTSTGSGFEGEIAISGSVLPGYDNEYNLGSPSNRWANLYTGDLHLRNERGDWTIYEERDMLVVVNNITGKRYKMGLTPLEDDE